MIYFSIKETGATPGVAKRELARIHKAALTEAMKWWHRKFRPKHFTIEGAREYGYTKRKGERMAQGTKRFRRSYTGRKLARMGHALPLVYTGRSRERTRHLDIRATSQQARVVLHANALNFKHPKSRVNMRREMTTVSDAEVQTLVMLFGAVQDRQLKAIRTTRTRRL